MPTRPQVPRIAQLLGPAIDAWVAARPGVLPFLNLGAGRYADVVAGWEAQCALLVRQIADEVASARLASAVGVALTQNAASEFRTLRTSGTVPARGRAVLHRGSVLAGAGVIPEGFRFFRNAVPTYNPPLQAATYTATRDVSYVGTSVSVPIVASLPGSSSNAPYYDGDNTAGGAGLLQLEDTPFDPLIAVTQFEAAGGSDGEDDADLVLQAMANATGVSGPTLGAVRAGALSALGVHRAAVFDVAQATQTVYQRPITPTPVAYTGVAIADQSWASGANGLASDGTLGIWEGTVAQAIAGTPLQSGGQGFGGLIYLSGTANVRVYVNANVTLRSADYLRDTSAVDAALLRVARSYFDDRPDWWTWTTGGLQAWLSRAHPNILSCPAATVWSFATGLQLAEPPSTPTGTLGGIAATHYALVQNGLTPTYSAAT